MELRAKVTRVLPIYKDLISDYMGAAQIALGILTLVLGITGFIIKSFTSAASMGVFTAILLNITGIMGVVAGMKKELWAIASYFSLSVITVIISLVLFMASITAIGYESGRERTTSATTRESIDICLLVLGLLGGSTCVCSILLTGIPLFTDCCKCAEGAKYVEEPNVEYQPNGNTASNSSIQVGGGSANGDANHDDSDTYSVKETRHGNIHSFENPQTENTESPAAAAAEIQQVDLSLSEQGSALPI